MTDLTHIKNMPLFCSWSGGKDSCLALYRAVKAHGSPRFLLTMFEESGERTRSHGLPGEIIKAQADSLGIPLVKKQTSWDDYESTFIHAATELKKRGVRAGIFGDIDIEDHLRWEEKVCDSAGVEALIPLWKSDRKALLLEFISLGFKAVIVVLNETKLNRRFLGRTIDNELIQDLSREGIDCSGELGEYHTAVTDGPLFSEPIILEPQKIRNQAEYSFLDFRIAG